MIIYLHKRLLQISSLLIKINKIFKNKKLFFQTKNNNYLNNNKKKMKNKIKFNHNAKTIRKMKIENKFKQKKYKNYQYNLII